MNASDTMGTGASSSNDKQMQGLQNFEEKFKVLKIDGQEEDSQITKERPMENNKETGTESRMHSVDKLWEGFKGKADRNIENIRKLLQDGYHIESEEMVTDIGNVSHLLGAIHSSSLTLSNKFELGRVICEKIIKEDFFPKMCEHCVRSKNTLPNVSTTETTMWAFFMNGTMFSTELCKAIVSFNGLLLCGKEALEKIFKPYTSSTSEIEQTLMVTYICATTHNLCTFHEPTVSKVKNAGYLPVYKKYLNCKKLQDNLLERIPFLAAAADIMNEKDGCLTGSRAEVEFIYCGIEEGIQCHSGQFNGWFPFELGKVLGQLAVFDNNKKQLVEYGALRPLNKLAQQPEEIEQLTAIKTLAHLAFDEDNRKAMVDDRGADVVQTLFDLAKTGKFSNVCEAARGVLWTLSELLHSSKMYSEQAANLFVKKTKGHIMISYSREQRPLLLKIKQGITKAGFKVWMDIEQMRDNVYDRMAEAIQGASVVLLSMSLSYQRSEYCRREAAYASSLKRNRIPLLVDPGYSADGWLAVMTAGDYHYDFINKPFEQKIAELISEIKLRTYPEEEIVKSSIQTQSHTNPDILPAHSLLLPSTPACLSRQKQIEIFGKFNKEEVTKWLEKHNLPSAIFGDHRATDIAFLANMKEDAPECYYKLIMKLTRKGSGSLSSLQVAADFCKALDDLTI